MDQVVADDDGVSLLNSSSEDGDQQQDSTLSKPNGEEDSESGWESTLVYLCFFILGSTFLLPWNSILVCMSYYATRLHGTRFESSYVSWVTVIYTLSNVGFLTRATITQHNSDRNRRITASILIITSLLLVFFLTTLYQHIDPNWFFGFLIIVSSLQAVGSAYLQTSVIGLSSLFGARYLQGTMSGQGAIGVVVSVVQLMASIGELGKKEGQNDDEEQIRASSHEFYLVAASFCGVALASFLLLIRLRIYRRVLGRMNRSRRGVSDGGSSSHPTESQPLVTPLDQDHHHHHHHSHAGQHSAEGLELLRSVEKKVRTLGLSVFSIFLVTLSVFPSLTGLIHSVNDDGHSNTWARPIVFVPMHFVIFNISDWLGRVLPALLPKLGTTQPDRLMKLCSGRVGWVLLLMVCNVDGSSWVILKSDLVYLVVLFLFGLSNGYLSTLCFIAAVTQPSLRPDEVDVASTCLVFYLTLGLASGSLLSFAIRPLLVLFS